MTFKKSKTGVKLADFVQRKQALIPLVQSKPPRITIAKESVASVHSTGGSLQVRKGKRAPVREVRRKDKGEKDARGNATDITFQAKSFFKFIDDRAVNEKQALLDFVRWTAVPKPDRKPKTQAEFATKCGVDRVTLSHWKNLLGFWQEVELYRDEVFHRYVSDYMYAMVKAARAGNPSAAKLLLQKYEGFSERIKTENEPSPKEISPEKIEQLNQALRNAGVGVVIVQTTPLHTEAPP